VDLAREFLCCNQIDDRFAANQSKMSNLFANIVYAFFVIHAGIGFYLPGSLAGRALCAGEMGWPDEFLLRASSLTAHLRAAYIVWGIVGSPDVPV
jgi:hypothetical protein